MSYIQENLQEFKDTNLLEWHNKGYKGQGVTVVVLDDGHPPFKITNVESPLNNDYPTAKEHKAEVCGVVREVAPSCRIIALNFFKDYQRAIDWVLEHKEEVDLINCSFTTTRTKANALEAIYNEGIPLICATGNGGRDTSISLPARLDFTIAIGAYNKDYSNASEDVDAVSYTDLYINTDNGIRKFTGTSCSTPFVTGMLACYLSFRKTKGLPKLTPEEIRTFIHSNCEDVYEEGFDIKSGYGLFKLPNIEEVEEMKFNDVPQGHWAEKAVKYVDEKGYMDGTNDGSKFEGDKLLSRYEMAQILYNIDHRNDGEKK